MVTPSPRRRGHTRSRLTRCRIALCAGALRHSARAAAPASARRRDAIEAEGAFTLGRKLRDVNQSATWIPPLADFAAARDRYPTAGDRSGEMKALIEIGVTENYLSRPEALTPGLEAERLARELDDRPAIARALRVLASIHALAGISTLRRGSTRRRPISIARPAISAAEVRSLNYTAVLYRRLGDVEKAIEFYERAMPLARQRPRFRTHAAGQSGRRTPAWGSTTRLSR